MPEAEEKLRLEMYWHIESTEDTVVFSSTTVSLYKPIETAFLYYIFLSVWEATDTL